MSSYLVVLEIFGFLDLEAGFSLDKPFYNSGTT